MGNLPGLGQVAATKARVCTDADVGITGEGRTDVELAVTPISR